MTTETPRTDEACVSREYIAREMDIYAHKFVLADVARTLERSLTAAEAERDALRARVAVLEAGLRYNSDLLDEASSPYIDGCGQDLEWCEQRDSTVAEARALLAPSSEPQP